MKLRIPLALVSFGLATIGQAQITSLTETWDGETPALNQSTLANWNVTAGGVDVIGAGASGTQFDLIPGNGYYLDLDGTSRGGGTITIKSTFAPGTYTFSFQLAGNQRNRPDDTVSVSFGSYTENFLLSASQPFTTYTRTVSNAGAAGISFSNAGADDYGALLNNVTVAPVPEPASMAALAIGAGALIRRRRRP